MIKDFVAIDLETTGLSPYDNKIRCGKIQGRKACGPI